MHVDKKELIQTIENLDSDLFDITEELLPPVKSFDIPDFRKGVDGISTILKHGKYYEREIKLFKIKAAMN